MQFLSAVADAIVLGVGAGLIHSGQLTVGALIAFILYIDMFFSPIQQLSQVFDSWQQTRVSVGRISELMRLETLTPEAPTPSIPGRLRGAVRLEDVHFSYPAAPARSPASDASAGRADPRLLDADAVCDRKPPEALRGVDICDRGRRDGRAGRRDRCRQVDRAEAARRASTTRTTGSGLGRRPGPAAAVDLPAFRRQLGYVPQEAFLFTGTVRDNIAYGRPEASDAEVEAAARAVGAHDFIAALAGGYLHEISERGRSLSSGQRQLIALARAELVDPAILLLDEATSNLDLATEARVAAAMQRVAHGRTTIVIAHRLQTARQADRIVVLAGRPGGRDRHARRAAGGRGPLRVDVGGVRAARRDPADACVAGRRRVDDERAQPAGDGRDLEAAALDIIGEEVSSGCSASRPCRARLVEGPASKGGNPEARRQPPEASGHFGGGGAGLLFSGL